MAERPTLHDLEDLWDASAVAQLDEAEQLRYRSNLLGRDLRLTNYGGGNTSTKLTLPDPLTGAPVEVLWVKGSGGDLGSIRREGFATLYLDKLRALEARYRGLEHEDEMVGYYPLCTFGLNPVAASIDTPLHGFLPFPHVDHLHPDWGIALAASANGVERLREFNQRFHHHLVWVPWQRPGFELGLMLRRAVTEHPDCDGIVLGGHGLFTWGMTQPECYRNTLTIIDQLGQLIQEHTAKAGTQLFGGRRLATRDDRQELARDLFPFLRGRCSGERRMLGTFCDLPEVLRFVNSAEAEALAALGTSCPDHFVRTKIRPMRVAWDPQTGSPAGLRTSIDAALTAYRAEYVAYYEAQKRPDSPALRDPNPTVVLVPGVGMFSFGKTKAESRIAGEFYVNAIHVMEGATALDDGALPATLPQAGAAPSSAFKVHRNYVALPLAEAFNIEYWLLEEAKLRRQPPEKEFSRKVLFVVGAGSGIGRETALLAARLGANLVLADRDLAACQAVAAEIARLTPAENVVAVGIDICDRASVRAALRHAVLHFGGIDVVINTAALFASSPDGIINDQQWRTTLDVNVTGNHLLADEARGILVDQALPAALILTSSANAVVAKAGSEAYDVSKAAVSHLVRELAVALRPHVRVNGISPATVVKGSSMFPRERVKSSLTKYQIAFTDEESTETLRGKLAQFYAARTLTGQPIEPIDCAEAILFLAGDRARRTTGHLIPVDGGLAEAFLR